METAAMADNEDAKSLYEWLKASRPSHSFNTAQHVNGELHVYTEASARSWDGEHTPRWNGRQVVWHFDSRVEAH